MYIPHYRERFEVTTMNSPGWRVIWDFINDYHIEIFISLEDLIKMNSDIVHKFSTESDTEFVWRREDRMLETARLKLGSMARAFFGKW